MGDVVWNETEGQVQDRLRARVARLEAEAAPLRAVLEQLKNVAKGIAHCYDELDEDERRELQQVCAESEAILLSPDAGKGARPQFVCNCNCHYTSEACCPECTNRRGKGGLPLEKVEQVASRLRSTSRVFHSEHGHEGPWSECKRLQCSQDRAALDALKGVK